MTDTRLPLRYVTIDRLSELSGYTRKALEGKIARGEFAEGKHYHHSADGRIHFDIEAYERWVLQGNTRASKTAAPRSVSTST